MNLDYKIFAAGYCKHPEFITIKGGSKCMQKFPALCFLIKHPNLGYILFDTGYTSRFYDETKKWPFFIYKLITPVYINHNQTLAKQFEQYNIKREDINYVIISHFHADHIAGIKDFPNAKLIYSGEGYNDVKNKKGFQALRKGFLNKLLPEDFENKSILVENTNIIKLDDSLKPFLEGWDILGDQSIIAIDLSGHAKRQIGIIFNNKNGNKTFLVADSCWSRKAYKEFRLPSELTYLVHNKRNDYILTLQKIHKLYKNNNAIDIIPSHCSEVWMEIIEEKNVR